MEPEERPVLHPEPRKVWRDALAGASIVAVGFSAAVFVTFWFMLH